MHRAACPPPWLALLACVAIGGVAFVFRACEPEYAHSAPRLAWVGDAYVTVWEEVDGDTSILQSARFSGTGAKRSRASGSVIWRSAELQSRPRLAGGDHSALVVALEGPNPDPDPNEDRSDPLRFLTVLALGADGRGLGSPRRVELADRICGSPAWDGTQFIVGFAYRMRHFSNDRILQLASISPQGALLHSETIASGQFSGCAVARLDRVLAMVVVVEHARRYSLVAYFVDVESFEEVGERVTVAEAQERVPWPELVAGRASWTAAYSGADGKVRIVQFDQRGVRSARTLDEVDPDTMSLGVNAVGAFVSWHSGGHLRLRGVDAGRTFSLGRARRTQTAAAGHDSECAIASSDGKRAVLSRLTSTCPR
jgi:hypothetical protein